MKILVVDDEKIFSDKLSEFLKILGYEVFNTYTGEEALAILEKEKPDVLISDLKLSMAGTFDGDDIITQLKAISPNTKPIILTAFTNEATQQKLLAKGAYKYLFKPVNFMEIQTILNELRESLTE